MNLQELGERGGGPGKAQSGTIHLPSHSPAFSEVFATESYSPPHFLLGIMWINNHNRHTIP